MSDPLSPEANIEAERLRQLRAQIEELLAEFDACAVVFLAGRNGRLEHFARVDASWSNLSLVGPQGGRFLRVRSKLADYGGDVERQRAHLEWSVGALTGLAELLGTEALPWLDAARAVSKQTNATHGPMERDDPRDPKPESDHG
jgi:hypothetical protein